MCGNHTGDSILHFWNHIKTLPGYKYHVLIHSSTPNELKRTIPFCLHGDGAEMYRDDEFWVMNWSSAFASSGGHDVLVSRYPILLVAERQMTAQHDFQQALAMFCILLLSGMGYLMFSKLLCLMFPNLLCYSLLMFSNLCFLLFVCCSFCPLKVREEVNQVIADVIAWSLRFAAVGVYPHRGFYGEVFEDNTFRKKLCGQQIAGGYRPLVMRQKNYI